MVGLWEAKCAFLHNSSSLCCSVQALSATLSAPQSCSASSSAADGFVQSTICLAERTPRRSCAARCDLKGMNCYHWCKCGRHLLGASSPVHLHSRSSAVSCEPSQPAHAWTASRWFVSACRSYQGKRREAGAPDERRPTPCRRAPRKSFASKGHTVDLPLLSRVVDGCDRCRGVV